MQTDAQPFPKLLKAIEVAELLNVSRAFAYQLMRKGIIPTVKISGARRVRPEDLKKYINENITYRGAVDIQ